MIDLIQRAARFPDRTAIISDGRGYTYAQLLSASEEVALRLMNGTENLDGARVAILIPGGFLFTTVLWGIWRAGGIAVPIYEKHPLTAISYILEDAGVSAVVCASGFEPLLAPISGRSHIRFLSAEENGSHQGNLPDIRPEKDALIIYTSGTIGSPKGVVTTHKNIRSQITALTGAWEWSQNDHVLNVLPLHHVHGLINILCCALWSGACCEFLPKFSPGEVFDIFCRREVNVFMAVPTIYFKLIAHYRELPAAEQRTVSESLRSFRLMVSGSAALPVSVLEQWKELSGHILLERYGMTEMGMAISNPYHGERKPGFVGQPLPGVGIRLRDEHNVPGEEGMPGEIQVKGENVFRDYWNRPEETARAFTPDGWFKTGDMALFEEGAYKIIGRSSVDIIKSGGYKLSALEIEEVLRTHPQITDGSVIGIPDDEWGELIVAGLIVASKEFNTGQLNEWLSKKLPAEKIPRKYLILDDLPRNAMGKVMKTELKKMFVK